MLFCSNIIFFNFKSYCSSNRRINSIVDDIVICFPFVFVCFRSLNHRFPFQSLTPSHYIIRNGNKTKKLRRRSYLLWYGFICFCILYTQVYCFRYSTPFECKFSFEQRKNRKSMEKHVVDTKWLMDFPCRCDTVFSIFIACFFLNVCVCMQFLLYSYLL